MRGQSQGNAPDSRIKAQFCYSELALAYLSVRPATVIFLLIFRPFTTTVAKPAGIWVVNPALYSAAS